jgi:hypothetical protein
MKTHLVVAHGSLSLAAALAVVILAAPAGAQTKQPAASNPAVAPAHRVVACYFHRTNRCPTCRKISAYIEEAVQAGYAKEIKDGRVAVAMVDFQDPRNQAYVAAYQIAGPTLVVMDVRVDKVTAWKAAPKTWRLVADKDAFFQYVQEEVRSYLK